MGGTLKKFIRPNLLIFPIGQIFILYRRVNRSQTFILRFPLDGTSDHTLKNIPLKLSSKQLDFVLNTLESSCFLDFV